MKITNTQPGPRGINSVSGPILIDAGQTVDDVKVYAREKEGLEASGWFTIEGDYEPNPSGENAPLADPSSGTADKAKIAELEGMVKAKDGEIADLKKKLPETDIEKMTVAELRGFLAFHDVAYDGSKDKKPELLEKAKGVKVS